MTVPTGSPSGETTSHVVDMINTTIATVSVLLLLYSSIADNDNKKGRAMPDLSVFELLSNDPLRNPVLCQPDRVHGCRIAIANTTVKVVR